MRRALVIWTVTTAIVALGGSSAQGQSYEYLPPPCLLKSSAKLSLARASTVGGKLDVLAPISSLASGTANIDYHAAGSHTRFTSPVNSVDGRIRFRRTLPEAQARLGTGILTVSYPGDANTARQSVRLRAARNKSLLDLSRPQIVGDSIQASGTVSQSARGVVRLRLEYQFACTVRILKFRGTISNGHWRIDEKLSPLRLAQIALRTGAVYSYTAFTGYLQRRIGGAIRGYQVLGGNE